MIYNQMTPASIFFQFYEKLHEESSYQILLTLELRTLLAKRNQLIAHFYMFL